MSPGKVDWEAVARASLHPVQSAVLGRFESGARLVSPKQAWEALRCEVAINTVAYHFRALEKAGVLVWDHAEPRRGARENFYRLSPGAAL